jgi:uncharacterized protein
MKTDPKKTVVSRFAGTVKLPSGRTILWSGLTGFIGIFPSIYTDHLANNNLDCIPESIFDQLDNNGLFFNRDNDEDSALVDIVEKMSKQASHPTSYRLILTGKCNLKCGYCMQASLRKQISPRLSKSTLRDVVKYVEHNSLPGDIEILLMGGEPLYDVQVASDTINELCNKFACNSRNRPFFKILTNGLNLSAFLAKFTLPREHIRDIQVTLDQNKERHDSYKQDESGRPTYDRVVDGIKNAINKGYHVTLRINIHDSNRHKEFFETCESIYAKIGIENLTIYPALVIEGSQKNSIDSSTHFSQLLLDFFNWHYLETGQIHPRHIPPPKWISCPPVLGPPSILGPNAEVYSCSYAKPVAPNVDAALRTYRDRFPLSRDSCQKLVKNIWSLHCRCCKFLAFCTGVCSAQTAQGQVFTADCDSWNERFRTFANLIERR